jgi:hypothetical protein
MHEKKPPQKYHEIPKKTQAFNPMAQDKTGFHLQAITLKRNYQLH